MWAILVSKVVRLARVQPLYDSWENKCRCHYVTTHTFWKYTQSKND